MAFCSVIVLSENKSSAVSYCMVVELLPVVLMQHVAADLTNFCLLVR